MLVRAVWAIALLAIPGAVIRLAMGIDEPASRRAVRVLGARHLFQAGIEVRYGAPARRLGVWIDALHALTAAGFAVGDRRWRRPAAMDALVASAFAAIGRARKSRTERPDAHRR